MIPDARVLTQARKFAGEMISGWRELTGEQKSHEGLIVQHIVDDDALGLKSPDEGDPIADGGFDFRDNADKQADFEEWLDQQIRNEVLEPVGDRQLKRGGHYSGKYVRSTNDSGIRDAGTWMRKEGIEPNFGRENLDQVFNAPVRVSQLSTLYRRTYTELKGVTDDTAKEISRELAEGLSQGQNPRKIATRINERIDARGIAGSRRIARTELARSYNHGSLLRYERNSIEKVDIQNTSPCKKCVSYVEGGPYEVSEAYGILPIHPNCMGSFSPRVPGAS